MEVAACFRINVTCAGCLSRSSRNLAIPAIDEAPTDVDDLVDSGELDRMPFLCEKCEGRIATVTAIKRTYLRGEVAA